MGYTTKLHELGLYLDLIFFVLFSEQRYVQSQHCLRAIISELDTLVHVLHFRITSITMSSLRYDSTKTIVPKSDLFIKLSANTQFVIQNFYIFFCIKHSARLTYKSEKKNLTIITYFQWQFPYFIFSTIEKIYKVNYNVDHDSLSQYTNDPKNH